LYELYVNATTDLAQSIVVKFDALALGVNLAVLLKTGQNADPANPASWKYYQNICGQYHSSDTAMSVYSLDSENIIPFTVSSLAANPVTKAAYAFGSTYYNDLLSAYPDQEMLILGILYPANLTKALAAKDGTILAYPTHLVEPNEVDFIRVLQAWIYAYVHRWFNSAYTVTDNLYMAAFFGQFTLHLVGIITNLRLAACKTNQAHSFHIQQYLKSHGFLDAYMRQMSRGQALDMYRNINYYERNAGFEATFEQLVEVVLSAAGLPAYRYEMLHNQESLQHENAADTQHLLSIAHFKRSAINERGRQYPLPTVSLPQLHAIAADQTPYNDAYQDAHYEEISHKLSLSRHARLPTKVIECAINPVGTPSALPTDAILFAHWIDWVSESRYAVPVEFVPEGDKVPVRLTHQQAVAIWIYATHRAREPEDDPDYPHLTRVPPIQVSRALRTPKPLIEDLYAVVSKDTAFTHDVIEEIHASGVVIPSSIASLTEFQQQCGRIYTANILQFNLYSFQQDPQARGNAQAAAARLYADKVVRLDRLADPDHPELGMEFNTLIQQLGLNFTGYRAVDYYNTAIRIMSAATGSDLNDLLDPANVQQAMVSLLRYLSSYSIQIVMSGASALRTTVPRPDVRVHDVKNESQVRFQCDLEYVTALGMPMQEAFHAQIKLDRIPVSPTAKLTPSFHERVPVSPIPVNAYKARMLANTRINTGLTLSATGFDPDTLFWALTPEQRDQVVDVYRI
jgi:hypothetical protein